MCTVSRCKSCLCHRRGNQRNTRRNREEEHPTVSEVLLSCGGSGVGKNLPSPAHSSFCCDEPQQRPAPLMKAAAPESPKFDLAASNFPPLPGSAVSVQGETTTEMRLSDVVRGMKATSKVRNPTRFGDLCSTREQVHVLNWRLGPFAACQQRGEQGRTRKSLRRPCWET